MVAELFVEFRSGPSFEQEWPVDHRQIGLFVHVQMSLSQKTGSVERTESRWKIIRFGLEKAESEGSRNICVLTLLVGCQFVTLFN